MNEETNGNEVNYAKTEGTIQDGIENAFSDLISEYFEEGNNTQNAGNIQTGTILDWDSVANGQLHTNNVENVINGLEYTTNNAETLSSTDTCTNSENVVQTNGVLYNNLETVSGGTTSGSTKDSVTDYNVNAVGYGDDSSYWDTPIYNTVSGKATTETTYNENTTEGCNGLNNETIAQNAYGVITVNGDLLKGVNTEGVINNTVDSVNTVNTIETAQGTDFKLTQGNLPAKIGFWTKVRNFFISDSKIQYSVQQPTQGNTGIWNKVQNFFSFGKNK